MFSTLNSANLNEPSYTKKNQIFIIFNAAMLYKLINLTITYKQIKCVFYLRLNISYFF